MNDDDEKPHSNRIYYWLSAFILAGLVALVGQYLLWKYKTSNTEKSVTLNAPLKNEKLLSAIRDYIQWTDALPNDKMDIDHELTRTGLRKIAAVFAAYPDSLAGDKATQVQSEIGKINTLADSLNYNWKSGKHADMIKTAFSTTIDAVTSLNWLKYPAVNAEIAILRLKIDAIDKKILTLEQRDVVKDAFKQTKSVFKKLEFSLQQVV
jgi:hypothetical protein